MASRISVPAFPLSAVRATELFRIADPGPDDVMPIVERDPGLTAAVLRAANSASSSPAREINTARVGVIRIGARATRRLVLAEAVGRSFGSLAEAGIDTDELWLHLCACASVADQLSLAGGSHSEAFTAGILHDIGRMALAVSEPQDYARVVAAAALGEDICEMEREVFDVDHAEWGARICQEWGLPADLVEAIADHHEGASSGLSWAVATARQLVSLLGIGDGLGRPVGTAPEGELLAMLQDLGGPEVLLRNAQAFRFAVRETAA